MDVDGPPSGVGVSTMKTVNGEGVGGGVCVVVGARVAVLIGGSVGAVYALASATCGRSFSGVESRDVLIPKTEHPPHVRSRIPTRQ
jgi:hypothetical protein